MLPALWSRTSLGNPCAGDRATSLLGGCAAGNSSNCLCRDAIGGNFVKARTRLYFRQGGWLQVGTAPGAGSRRALPFNAVVPIAAKTAPVRFGARASIHSGRAVSNTSPSKLTRRWKQSERTRAGSSSGSPVPEAFRLTSSSSPLASQSLQ